MMETYSVFSVSLKLSILLSFLNYPQCYTLGPILFLLSFRTLELVSSSCSLMDGLIKAYITTYKRHKEYELRKTAYRLRN